jgi:hypothetical protein
MEYERRVALFQQSSPGCVACRGPLHLSTDATGDIIYWAFRVVFNITVGAVYTEDMEAVYYPPGLVGSRPVVAC